MSIHGLLAAELALGIASGKPHYPAWNAVLPTSGDIKTSVPLMWPPGLRRLLPAGMRTRLQEQESMFVRDWAAFSGGFPAISRSHYIYAWLLVNSRTFYYETTRTAAYPWIDRLAQLPVADLFNHSAVPGCKVSFSAKGYEVVAIDDFGAGQEMSISYGDHSNDYLLVEYGFVMQSNRCDDVHLDDVILPRLDKTQRGAMEGAMVLRPASSHPDLEEKGGRKDESPFTSALAGPKLQTALKNLAMNTPHGPDHVLGDLIGEYLVRVKETLEEIQSMTGLDAERELLSRRWEQIRETLEGTRRTMGRD